MRNLAHRLVFCCVLAGATASFAACGGGGGGGGAPSALAVVSVPTAPPTPAPTATPRPFAQSGIQHVVVVIQENRSFDNLFNGYPGADTVTSGVTHTGAQVALQPVPFEAPFDPDHTHWSFLVSYDGAKLDGFDRIPMGVSGATPAYTPPPFANYAFVPQSETKPYWEIASKYTLADRMFQSNSGPSFPAHLYLVAGDSSLAYENPTTNETWGCDSPAATIVQTLNPDGTPGSTVAPCFDLPSLADQLQTHNIAWRYYTPALTHVWSAFDAVRSVRYGPQWGNVVMPETTILKDVAAGHLPQLSWVVPSRVNSDHSVDLGNSGPDWVASIVNTIGNSPYWSNTAIIIVWDDWGGWYDHVNPPQLDKMGLGFRVPLMVVSPYAKSGYVSHVQHEFGSVLKFTEEVFGLTTLGKVDMRADDLGDMFDFTQKQRPYSSIAVRKATAELLRAPSVDLPPDD